MTPTADPSHPLLSWPQPLLQVSALAGRPEAELVAEYLALLAPLRASSLDIIATAKSWVQPVRERGPGMGVEAFLQEYGLSSAEGVAVMCLAEALLRIPDSATVDALIRDKFTDRQWQQHVGHSSSLWVNASSWGLLLTGKVVELNHDAPATLWGRLAARMGEGVVREALRSAMRIIGQQFVMGETIEEALRHAQKPAARGYRFSFDILGEGARTQAQATHYLNAYHDAIDHMAKARREGSITQADSLSIKLSALHPRYSLLQHDRVMAELLPRVIGLMEHARKADIMVTIDAEEAARLDSELALFTALLNVPSLAGWNGVGFVVQAYNRRSLAVVEYLAGLARAQGRIIPLRLVKGAYWDYEIKQAQLQGLAEYPVFTRKEHTDLSYLAVAQHIFSNLECFYPQFATHNAHTIAAILTLAKYANVAPESFEFQRLHGMGEALHDQLLAHASSRVYAPVGPHRDLLAYLIRRLLENGANSSFVHQLADPAISLDVLLHDPLQAVVAHGGTPHPAIPLPSALYGAARKNSTGHDFGSAAATHGLLAQLGEFLATPHEAASLVSPTMASLQAPVLQSVRSPRWHGDMVGSVTPALPAMAEHAMKHAAQAQPAWGALSTEVRARVLEKVADELEATSAQWVALLVREAGKTLPDAIAEIREAADFCRYYAAQALLLSQVQTLPGPTGESNRLSLAARGVFVCISPWNFPLAIFMGQVVAALVMGNAVVAKPAEQTPIIAHQAVQLLHRAGVPPAVLQLVLGEGETVGAALVAQPLVAGVVFTGSVQVAQVINRSLAARTGAIVPLIAETGGQNCMVVDSSALLETAVDDIIISAFGSAGQRCSALRILLVQEDIAQPLLTLLAGALQELRLGDPADPATDIGPVIDAVSHAQLRSHIERMHQHARFVASTPLPDGLAAQGHFIAPHIFELDDLSMLTQEIFGPVLHVVRFAASELASLPLRINALGYGLTFGVHSRIDEHIHLLINGVHAGNYYINRSMIGATVGVQPFGGEGLSGTGPKAGGPHYLLRFASERTTTHNTTAIGGNIGLLKG
jgi:RHH-type transcriptional regulator, proline utilization regulon repressor / proline dehydrogenase / delta 1-pyrroline-5-carboxylate dehydrogenase